MAGGSAAPADCSHLGEHSPGRAALGWQHLCSFKERQLEDIAPNFPELPSKQQGQTRDAGAVFWGALSGTAGATLLPGSNQKLV